MTIARVNASGWAVLEKLTSTQANGLDLNGTYALDKRASQTDTLESVVSTSGAGRIIDTPTTGADADTTYTRAAAGGVILAGTLTAQRTYTLSNTGAVSGDRIIILAPSAYNVIIHNAAAAQIGVVGPSISSSPWAEFEFNGSAWVAFRTTATAVDITVSSFRLSLTTGVTVPTADVTGATTLYLVPEFAGSIALFNGTYWEIRSSAQISKAIGTLTTSTNYDVYVYWTGSALDMEFVAWTNDTTPASRSTLDGVHVKTGDTTRRRVGAFRTTATTTTEDSASKRFLYNGPERPRQITRPCVSPAETTNSWTHASSNNWEQARSQTSNRVEVLVGDDVMIDANVRCMVQTSSIPSTIGIGLDSTTVNSAQKRTGMIAASAYVPLTAQYVGALTKGYRAINWLTKSEGGAGTFYGDGGYDHQSGLTAMVPG